MTTSKTNRYLIKVLPDKQAFFCESDQTVLEAGLAAGHALPHSCQGGNCGSCVATILAGNYEYQTDTVPMGISPEQRQQGQALLCQIKPRSTLTFESISAKSADDIQVQRLPCRIVRRELVAHDVVKLDIQLPRSQPLRFHAGQHIKLKLDHATPRTYSIASSPTSGALLELHVRRVKNGVFSEVAFDLAAGSTLLRMEGPFGQFQLSKSDEPIVMIAGGTGYAPIKAMLLDLWQQPSHPPVHLFWGGRDHQDLYEYEFLQQQARANEAFSFTPVVETHDANQAKDQVGVVHEVAFKQAYALEDSQIYASGPPAMIKALLADARRLGIADENLHCDVFDYAS